jgi:hypothetical protein
LNLALPKQKFTVTDIYELCFTPWHQNTRTSFVLLVKELDHFYDMGKGKLCFIVDLVTTRQGVQIIEDDKTAGWFST